jgi:hypothetical protein
MSEKILVLLWRLNEVERKRDVGLGTVLYKHNCSKVYMTLYLYQLMEAGGRRVQCILYV